MAMQNNLRNMKEQTLATKGRITLIIHPEVWRNHKTRKFGRIGGEFNDNGYVVETIHNVNDNDDDLSFIQKEEEHDTLYQNDKQ